MSRISKKSALYNFKKREEYVSELQDNFKLLGMELLDVGFDCDGNPTRLYICTNGYEISFLRDKVEWRDEETGKAVYGHNEFAGKTEDEIEKLYADITLYEYPNLMPSMKELDERSDPSYQQKEIMEMRLRIDMLERTLAQHVHAQGGLNQGKEALNGHKR